MEPAASPKPWSHRGAIHGMYGTCITGGSETRRVLGAGFGLLAGDFLTRLYAVQKLEPYFVLALLCQIVARKRPAVINQVVCTL